ncbi:MAG TPA: TonB family protein, partial [Usitatibacter sp.]|nr:TonB family protein [Usitatibacter sp.]
MTFSLAPRATPLAAVAAIHVLAVGALLHTPAVRQRLVEATPLFVEFVSAPKPRMVETSVPTPVLRAPREVQVAPPQIVIEQVAPTIAVTKAELPQSPSRPSAEPLTTAVVSAAVETPRFDLAYLRNPAPAYPSMSRRLHEQGRVMLRVRVAASGDPREVRVESSSGSERLDRAAVEAVRHWRFAPARRGGEPIDGEALVPI